MTVRTTLRALFGKERAEGPFIWNGVYPDFDSVPDSGPGYEVMPQPLSPADVAFFSRDPADETVQLEHELLMMFLGSGTNGAVRVVDFGGGYGTSYLYVRSRLPRHEMKYVVVDLPGWVEGGRSFFRDDPAVEFRTSLPEQSPDVVFIKSALQYVPDHRATAAALFGMGALHVIYEKFAGVTSPTYVAGQQNLPGGTIPHRFIAFDELFAVAKDCGYERVLWRRLPRVYDQSNYPPAMRMHQASSLVFRKV
jgi:putative methyltransferase (TIGR04325 family)